MSAAEIAALGGPRAEGMFVRRLRATLADPNLSLMWSGAANTRLQRATTLTPAGWQDVPGTLGASSHVERVTNATTFFRLLQQ